MLEVISPLDQLYELNPAGAESVTLPVPQSEPPPVAVMVGLTGAAITVNVNGSEAGLVEVPSPTMTVNVPDVFAVIFCVVNPLLHVIEKIFGRSNIGLSREDSSEDNRKYKHYK